MSVWLSCSFKWLLALKFSRVIIEHHEVPTLNLPLVKRLDGLVQLNLALSVQRQ